MKHRHLHINLEWYAAVGCTHVIPVSVMDLSSAQHPSPIPLLAKTLTRLVRQLMR